MWIAQPVHSIGTFTFSRLFTDGVDTAAVFQAARETTRVYRGTRAPAFDSAEAVPAAIALTVRIPLFLP